MGYAATCVPQIAAERHEVMPVGGSSGAEGSAGAAPNAAPGQVAPESGDQGAAIAGQIFMYPKNGQSAQQQAIDKAQCQQWAQQQAGQVAQNGSDYMRAMAACVEGRGHSAR